MAKKRELSEQEKVAEILKKANINFDAAKAQQMIALNTRCHKCGRTLSSLERITFENTCATCMEEIAHKKRDTFARKYIIIAFIFAIAIVFGGYCANSDVNTWKIVGVVVSALLTGVSLGYVFYSNINKMLPGLNPKYQAWAVILLAFGIAFVIGMLTYVFSSWILYVILMLAVAAYVVYIAYGEFNSLKERNNLLDVYNRKARDKEYVESITEAIEARAQKNEQERLEREAAEALNEDSVNKDEVTEEASAEEKPEEKPDEKSAEVSKALREIINAVKSADNDDSGDFSI